MGKKDYSAVLLRTSNGSELELVAEFGGLANRLKLSTATHAMEVIAGLDDRHAMETDQAYRNIALFPFANRLDGGRYYHLDQLYQLPVNEPERDNCLHGFLHHLRPKVETSLGGQSSEALLRYGYEGQMPGYPFPADIEMRFKLSDDGSLDVSMSVANRHSEIIPVGVGWHPYFKLGSTIDDLQLRLPPVQEVLVDHRMLPTGELRSYEHFKALQSIENTVLDTCFAITPNHDKVASALLWSEREGCGIEVWQQVGDRGLNYIQVCTAPDRRSIAIEPVGCGLNAFNTGEGLVMLEPGELYTAHFGVRLLTRQMEKQ